MVLIENIIVDGIISILRLIVIVVLQDVIWRIDRLLWLIVDIDWWLWQVWLLRCVVDGRRWWLKWHGLRLPDFYSCVRLSCWCWIIGKKLKDVIIDNYLTEVDIFPAVGTLPGHFKSSHTFPADGVVHGTDDDWLLLSAVVLRVADVAFVDGILEFFCKTVTIGHLTILFNLYFNDQIIQRKIVVRGA